MNEVWAAYNAEEWKDAIAKAEELIDEFEPGARATQETLTDDNEEEPPVGNVTGFAAGGNYPFAGSQYDVHEGILDPLIDQQTTDPATRLPDGILTIGFHGYRIVQPPGTVSLT